MPKKPVKKAAKPGKVLEDIEAKKAAVIAVEKALAPVFKRLGVKDSVVVFTTEAEPGILQGWRKGRLEFVTALADQLLQEPPVRALLMAGMVQHVVAQAQAGPPRPKPAKPGETRH
jgi:hypothetical protein